MPLSRAERRTLRRLGRAVEADDPAFARMLRGRRDTIRSRNLVIRRLAWAFLAVATIMLAAGAITGDVGLLTGGGLVLLSCPPTLLIIAPALALDR